MRAATKPRHQRSRSPRYPTSRGDRVDGLTLFERDNFFHVRGTLRQGRNKRRVRQTLGIEFTEDNREAAEAAARKRAAEVRAELGGAIRPKSVAEGAEDFLTRPKGESLGPTDVNIIKRLAARFGLRLLRDIAPAEFLNFVDDCTRGNKAESRERVLNTVCAFLGAAIKRGQYQAMPAFERDRRARNPNHRARRPVTDIRPYLLQLLIELSHIAIGAQICVEAATGARVSSVLFGCALKDLLMHRDQMQIAYHDTKNGDDVVAALPESVRTLLEFYLEWRALQVAAGRVSAAGTAPLFLTPRGQPYKPNPNYLGTRNKTGFNAAKRRAKAKLIACAGKAIADLEAAGDVDGAARARQVLAEDLDVLAEMTQHWLRHKLATDLGRVDLRLAMRQGGWRDVRSVQGYLIEDASLQRAAVEERVLFETNLQQVLFDTHLTRRGSND